MGSTELIFRVTSGQWNPLVAVRTLPWLETSERRDIKRLSQTRDLMAAERERAASGVCCYWNI